MRQHRLDQDHRIPATKRHHTLNWCEGYVARVEGRSRESCSYRGLGYGLQRLQWEAGWGEADASLRGSKGQIKARNRR